MLSCEENARMLAGNVLTSKSVRLQTEYMGTRKTKMTLHGVAMDITDERLADFYSQFGDVSAVDGKTGNDTGD